MSKQQVLPIGGGQRSFVGRFVMFVIVVGLVAWFIKSPVEAAAGVKTAWSWFMGAIDAVKTFFDHVVD